MDYIKYCPIAIVSQGAAPPGVAAAARGPGGPPGAGGPGTAGPGSRCKESASCDVITLDRVTRYYRPSLG